MTDQEINIARQPIFDGRSSVYGYELLFRDPAKRLNPTDEPEKASSRVIETTLITVGLEVLTGGKRAFLNFPREFLVQRYYEVLPPERVVIELLETIQPDPQVLEACRRLKASGYMMALDDFIYRPDMEPLIELADMVKVDVQVSRTGHRKWLGLLKNRVSILAEKVETRQEYDETLGEGFEYFQGYFFCRPRVVTQKAIPGSKSGYLMLMQQLSAASLDFAAIERALKQDMSLAFKLLRYLNSAAFFLRHEITSLRHALSLLGEDGFRRWAMIILLGQMSLGEPPELLSVGMTRARMCERIAEETAVGGEPTNLFFTGLFSILDAVLGVEMHDAVDALQLVPEIRTALLGESSPYRPILELVLAYERADWARVDDLNQPLHLSGPSLSQKYTESVEWARRVLAGMSRPD